MSGPCSCQTRHVFTVHSTKHVMATIMDQPQEDRLRPWFRYGWLIPDVA